MQITKTKEIKYTATDLTKTKSDKMSTNTQNQKPKVTASKNKEIKIATIHKN